MTPLARLAYGLAAAIVLADQALKYWVMQVFDLPARIDKTFAATGERYVGVLGPFHLSFVENTGVSFGILNIGAEWARWLLSAFSIVVAAGLAWWVRRAEKPMLAVAVGLIIGGAIGNVVDRIRLGT